MSYSEKHKRSTSPILRTTSEDRKAIHSNKDNYIQYLEQQLEKTATMVHKKYEDRMRCVEEVVQEHEEKFESFVKLIKLLQHFAETQEQENSNIRSHINTSMEQLYNNELRTVKQQLNQFEQQVFELQQISQRELPIQEFEQTINRKIDVIMDEVRQSVLKVDYQKLEQRVGKLELKPDSQIKSDRLNNSNEQLNDLKIVLDSVIQDQEQIKNTVNKLQNEINTLHRKTSLPKPIRNSATRESLQSEYEVLRPVRENKRQESRKKSKSSQSRSESRNARLETIKKKKQESVKELIKKHKQSSQKH